MTNFPSKEATNPESAYRALGRDLARMASMPNAFASTEGSLLGLQSSIGLALTHSFDLHHKQDALVRKRYSCLIALLSFTRLSRQSSAIFT